MQPRSSYSLGPLQRGEELVARVGLQMGGPPYFGVQRRDGGYQHLTGNISRRSQRRIEKALRRAFGPTLTEVPRVRREVAMLLRELATGVRTIQVRQ